MICLSIQVFYKLQILKSAVSYSLLFTAGLWLIFRIVFPETAENKILYSVKGRFMVNADTLYFLKEFFKTVRH